MQAAVVPIMLFLACAIGLAAGLLAVARLFNPRRPGRAEQTPYEGGTASVCDTRRQFDVRFHLVTIAFLVFDVGLLFLYPWAVATRPAATESDPTASGALASVPSKPVSSWGIDAAVAKGRTKERRAKGYVVSREPVFVGAMVFIGLLTLGFIYDWRKGIFQWR